MEIRQFDDRLEVSSPGGLPGYITLDNIVEEHFSRNPRLVNGLFEWGYIEQLGLGIDRMIEEMVHPAIRSRISGATPYSFTVILRRNVDAQPRRPLPEWATGMNERQIRGRPIPPGIAAGSPTASIMSSARTSRPRRCASTWSIWWRRRS